MLECVEFEGKTLKKAVKQACDRLNISKENLKYEVISHGSTGIFGLVGTRKARIRVSVPANEPTPIVAEAEKPALPVSGGGEEKAHAPGEQNPDEHERNFADDSAEMGRELIERIIATMTSETSIRVRQEDRRLEYHIEGGNPGIMIGKRGQTLEAIHYLVEKIINKHSDKRIRVIIDVGGYLENRKENLRQLAGRMAKKARQTGKPATVGQMNAHDRRIIHLALKDDTSIRTQSVGEGYIRKLVIFPKRRPSKRRNDRLPNDKDKIGTEQAGS